MTRVHWRTPRSKYGARATTIDGVRFDSRWEARRYGELRLRVKAGEVRKLSCHPIFPLLTCALPTVRGAEDLLLVSEAAPLGPRRAVAHYAADFLYEERVAGRWQVVVEDAKGLPTQVYRLKKKWFEAQYGLPVREVYRD